MKYSEVIVKVSECQKCNGIVRIAIKHLMSNASKKEFAKEVLEYNLKVREQPLSDYRNSETNWCKCKD